MREVTAACGPLVYRSDLFPTDAYGDIFIAEPSGNLVKRLSIDEQPNGALVGHNTYPDAEFLTSTDERFRPVNLHAGPDGALYVVDMYRGIIQHRIFVTTFLRNQILDRGLDRPLGMGRIYRIVPDAQPISAPLPTLSPANPKQLIAALSHPNSWQRETAQRLLVELADSSMAPALRKLIKTSTGPGRINALWVLDSLKALDQDTLLAALNSRDSDLLISALQASESQLAANPAALVKAVLTASQNSDPAVRRQAALSIAYAPTAVALPTLADIARRDDKIEGMPEAIISGLRGQETAFLQQLATSPALAKARRTATVAAATVVARKDPQEIETLLAWLDSAATDSALAAVITDGLQRNSVGKKADRQRIKLPVEPTALIAFTARSQGKQKTELEELLQRHRRPRRPKQSRCG